MKKFAANATVVLSVISAPIIFFSATMALGDPAPGVPQAVVNAAMTRAMFVACFGIAGLFAAIWLAGFSFVHAPKRSILATACCIVSMLALWLMP